MAAQTTVTKVTVSGTNVAHGVQSVGTTAAQLTDKKLAEGNFKGILIKAPGPTDDTPNTNSIYVGGKTITANQTGTGGFPLAPGESISIPIESAEFIYTIATDTNQKANWILL